MTETNIQMRFADVDILGHVNNVNQQHYFDLGKSDFFAWVLHLGSRWQREGLIMVSTRTDYKAQIFMDSSVCVTTRPVEIGNKSFRLFQQILDTETREVKTECTTVLVAFDFEAQRSIELPASWREKLSEHLEGEGESR